MNKVSVLSFEHNRTPQQALIDAMNEDLTGCTDLVVYAEYEDGDHTLLTSKMQAKDLLWVAKRLEEIALGQE